MAKGLCGDNVLPQRVASKMHAEWHALRVGNGHRKVQTMLVSARVLFFADDVAGASACMFGILEALALGVTRERAATSTQIKGTKCVVLRLCRTAGRASRAR